MLKTRIKVDYREDALIFADDNYIVYKKFGKTAGILESAGDLVDIGLLGLAESLSHLKYKKDKLEVVNRFIKDLEKIKTEIK